MQQTCKRCGEKVKSTYKIVAGHKLSADLCQTCYNGWYDLRDRLVDENFRAYLVSKSK